MPVVTLPDSEAQTIRSKSPTREAEKQTKTPDWDAAQMQPRRYYRSLIESHEPYLNDEDESMMRIVITPMDLYSDSVLDGGPAFIKRASPNGIEAMVESNKTWGKPFLDPIEEDDESGHPKHMDKEDSDDLRSWHASYMLKVLRNCTHTPPVNMEFTRFNPEWEYIDWDDWSELNFWDSESSYLWSIESIFESRYSFRPHVHALLYHAAPLRDDKLTTGEMAIATGIISSRRCFKGFHNHRYIPVTIFSASFRDMRIVQVWHDRDDPNTLHVRRSPIVDFTEGEEYKWVEWVAFCHWFMGDQLEDTMPDYDPDDPYVSGYGDETRSDNGDETGSGNGDETGSDIQNNTSG